MNSIINNNQSNGSIYTYLTQVQALYLQYIQIKTRLNILEENLKILNAEFDRFPTPQNLRDVQNIWDQKLTFMQQIPQIVNSIVANLTEATKFVLTSIQSNIANNNRLGVTLNDNAIASICSLVEQDSYQLNIKELYKQYCIIQNIPMQLSDIEIRTQMMGLSLPNFNRLKRIIRGY